uniref:Reductase n=1 Tax=Fusarium babinda TaxID=48486 RepID=A0A0X8IJ53_9HYPO|nr:reductase [Fusarium babinda]
MAPPFPNIASFTKSWHTEPYPFISPTRPQNSAAGKNIVITGGGSGIGQATGIAFAQAGAKSIAIVGRRLHHLEASAKAIQAVNPSTHVLFETGDVVKGESISATLKTIVDKVGKIDVFIANAGMLPTNGLVSDYDESKLREGFEVNFMGAFNSLQAFLPLAASGAQVFYIGSGIGHWALMSEVPGVFAYAAAKSAALKMVDYFAHENPHIHVVGIQPGIIATGINPDITIGFDTVDLPAHFMVWLASKEAEFLKGKFVWANWDAEELMARAEEIKSSMLLRVTLNGAEM